MKRLLLTLICCSPLLLTPSVSLSISLTGPSDNATFSNQQYGPVSPVDTLWGIASKLRPNRSVSVQQTMVALYKLNPYAFYQGDINKIIASSMLNVPSLELVQEQTNQEAIALINKYSPQKKTITKPLTVEAPVKKVEKVIEKAPTIVEISPVVTAESEEYKEKAASAESKISELEKELQLLSEQFIVATEATQSLKLKLQPLNDQIAVLSEQVEAEITVQQDMQRIIDEYRAQLDAIEPPPFSGDGIINEILRLITSSLTNLLITIISPIILLLLLFVAISRIRSKRHLAEQEKEMAESTAILMEESGQFDELLTDDIEDANDEKSDFTEEKEIEEPENTDLDDLETIDLTEDASLDIIDLTAEDESAVDIDEIDLDEIDLDEIDLDEEEAESNEDDPFGIGALADDIESMPEIVLDDDEIETNEDDPFGIGALTDDNSENDDSENDDDPFGIGSLAEDEELISTESTDSVSAAEQADLDLAAEWEAQVAAESESSIGDNSSESDATELELDFDPSDIDALDKLVANNTPEVAEDDGLIASDDDLDELLANNPAEILVEEDDDLIASDDDLDKLLANNPPETLVAEVDDLIASDDDLDELLANNPPETLVEDEVDDLIATEPDLDELLANNSPESVVEDTGELIEEEISNLTESDSIDETDLQELENDLEDFNVDELDELNNESIPELEIDDDLEALNVDDLTSELLSETVVNDELDASTSDSLPDEEDNQELPSLSLDDLETDLPDLDGDNDLLAQQISDVAFNEEVDLPTVNDTEDDFIDIETLLESSGSSDTDEPYTELDLDLGLEDFPDVVELQNHVDIDDDENGVGTQLDLARAYLEIDDKAAAKDILLSVVDNSNGKQRIEIDKLLSRLT